MAVTAASAIHSSPKKAGKSKASKAGAKKPKTPVEHPTFDVMVKKAVIELKERKGASRQAIVKYILSNYKVGTDLAKVNKLVKNALHRSLKNGILKHAKATTTGAHGRFKLADNAEKPKKAKKAKKSPAKKASPQKAKKPSVKKSKTAPSPKKAKPAKKTASKKSPKKATKKPTKK